MENRLSLLSLNQVPAPFSDGLLERSSFSLEPGSHRVHHLQQVDVSLDCAGLLDFLSGQEEIPKGT